MDINEFKQLAKSLDDFFSVNTGDAGKLKASLTNVLMAQDFQDLTSQIIKKVIKLVEEVEGNLVEIIKLTGGIEKINGKKVEKRAEDLAGPVVPGVNDSDSTVSGQDDVDELLSSLGF
jgi:chemotaxis protein CheZ